MLLQSKTAIITGCNRGIVDCTRCRKTGIITCTTCKGLGKYQEFKVYYQDYVNSCYPSFYFEEFAESNSSNFSKEKFIFCCKVYV